MKSWSIVAVLFVLAVASVSAYHMTNVGGVSDDDRRAVSDSRVIDVSDADRLIVVDSDSTACDINPHDSVNTCDMSTGNDGDVTTVSDTTFIDETTNVNDITTTSTTASEWILLRCRADGSTTVSDTGQTSSTFGRTTASNAQSGNNAFDRQIGTQNQGVNTGNRQTVSDNSMNQNSGRQNVNDDFTGRVTVNSMWTTVTTENGDQLECYVTDNAETMTLGSTGAGDTRGFESPVVYSGTLNTQRTADPNADANDVVVEGNANTGNRQTVSDTGSFNQQAD